MFIKILYPIAIHTYYVGFISICNGIIGADAVRPPSGGSRISRWGGCQFTGANRADYDAHLSSFLPYFI